MAFPQEKIKANQLQSGMIIHQVTELSFDYATLDEKALEFLKKAFTGASAQIQAEAGEKSIPVTDLEIFDQVIRIIDIPESLKIAKVVQGLGAQLEKRGLLEFLVSIPPEVTIPKDTSGTPEAPALHIGSAEARAVSEKKMPQVKEFLNNLEAGNSKRGEASSEVENMLDTGRSGKFTSKGVENVIDEIISGKSTTAMKAIAGLRGSDQTYAHCVDMSVILQGSYGDILERNGKEAGEKIKRFTLLAGFMHDIGKSEIPKEVLESTSVFSPDSKEMIILRNHTVYGAKILEDLDMHKSIVNVAHAHHVKKDPSQLSSYPDIPYEKVTPLTRLAAIVDVYQALIGRRKYKKNWVPGKAVEYIKKLENTEFDSKMLNHFIDSIGLYPVGSLVRFNTGALGFVVMLAPAERPERPLVALVENDKGERLPHTSLVDLMLEKDLSIVEIVDHYDYFNASDNEAYEIFSSLKI